MLNVHEMIMKNAGGNLSKERLIVNPNQRVAGVFERLGVFSVPGLTADCLLWTMVRPLRAGRPGH